MDRFEIVGSFLKAVGWPKNQFQLNFNQQFIFYKKKENLYSPFSLQLLQIDLKAAILTYFTIYFLKYSFTYNFET